MAINSLSASSYGLSGLASGMNTQEMVEKMLVGTQAKIDKAGQRKTTLQNKQQMYRDVATKLRELQTSFLSFTSGTNLRSNAFYNTMNATVTAAKGLSAAFSVTASSTAKVGNTTVDYIEQLATAGKLTSNIKAGGNVDGSINEAAAKTLLGKYMGTDARMTIKVGDQEARIDNATLLFGGMNNEQVVAELNDIFDDKGVAATARFINNKLEIIADDPDAYVTITSGTKNSTDKSLGMKMFGNVSSLSGKGKLTSEINTDNYLPSLKVTLDGREENIYLDLKQLQIMTDGTTTSAEKNAAQLTLLKGVQDQLKTEFGKGVELAFLDNDGNPLDVTFDNAGKAWANGVELTADDWSGFRFTTGESQKVTVDGDYVLMGALNMKGGVSNKLSTTMALKDLNFGSELQGNVFKFSINGVQFSYSGETSLETVMKDINNSKAGVKISYNESKNTFTMENAETGEGTNEIKIDQTEGNLMTVLFGARAGDNTTTGPMSKSITGDALSTSQLNALRDGGKLTLNVNGRNYTFTLSRGKNDDPFTPAKIVEKLNDAFGKSFGKTAEGNNVVSIGYANGQFSISSENPDQVITAVASDKSTNNLGLGFTVHDSTRVTSEGTTLDKAGIHFGAGAGVKIEFKDGTSATISGSDLNGESMASIASKLQTAITNKGGEYATATVSFDEKAGGFKIMGIDVPMEIVIEGADSAGSENLENLFGTNRLVLGDGRTELEVEADSSYSFGQNAKLSINGTAIERASNTFTMDGLTFTLNSTTPFKDGVDPATADPSDAANYESTLVSVARDTDTIVEGLKEFLKMYNETIDYINELYKADPTYKDYAPLTAAQKKDMSDREIELWEEKSKEGLLRGDQNLDKVLSSLRTAMNTKPDGSPIALFNLGIATSFYANDGNFVEDNTNDLKALIEADPDAVQRLFAGDNGIMELLNDAITNATHSSYGSPGLLVSVAGSNIGDTSSSIYKQIKEIDDQLTTLETRYWSEYNRYWKQFNNMEQMIQQMNTQSSWLSQQFSA